MADAIEVAPEKAAGDGAEAAAAMAAATARAANGDKRVEVVKYDSCCSLFKIARGAF